MLTIATANHAPIAAADRELVQLLDQVDAGDRQATTAARTAADREPVQLLADRAVPTAARSAVRSRERASSWCASALARPARRQNPA